MFNLNENCYLRNHFLKTNEIPTQSLINKKMSPPLAKVYFQSMTPKLKELVGLEPSLKGGGSDWYVPPKQLLEGRAVLKPINKNILSKLNYLGIDAIGMKMLSSNLDRINQDCKEASMENDKKWKNLIEMECAQYFHQASEIEAKKNTERIQNAFNEFSTLFSKSISTIENVLFDAARTEVIKMRKEAFMKMKHKYSILLKQQATTLYDKYTDKIMTEKSSVKAEFLQSFDKMCTEMGQSIHDINLDKHIAIEKVRKYLECRQLACQVYVALKEREKCGQELELMRYEQTKKVKILMDEIAAKDVDIFTRTNKQNTRQEITAIWRKKACRVVKHFQTFVTYCLKSLPEQADFFINMEKLLLLQLNEAIDNPTAESIFEVEEDIYKGPRPNPHPFYLFCDKGIKAQVNQDLCPKSCTSIASQMPVIVINKRYMYAACNTFDHFSHNLQSYIHGKFGNDADLVDDEIYENYVPVKYTASQQLRELKLESSLLQVLQQEIANINKLPIECGVCKTPHCFCSPPKVSITPTSAKEKVTKQQSPLMPSRNIEMTISQTLNHTREPKWDSYLEYVEPKKCGCPKTVKKHLKQHLPVYMRKMSAFDTPELPNYEPCSLNTLQEMVKRARVTPTTSPQMKTISPKYIDMATQCTDLGFDELCNCFSEDEIRRFFMNELAGSVMFDSQKVGYQFNVVDDLVSKSFLNKSLSSFAKDRAYSLRCLIEELPEIKEIFKFSDRGCD